MTDGDIKIKTVTGMIWRYAERKNSEVAKGSAGKQVKQIKKSGLSGKHLRQNSPVYIRHRNV